MTGGQHLTTTKPTKKIGDHPLVLRMRTARYPGRRVSARTDALRGLAGAVLAFAAEVRRPVGQLKFRANDCRTFTRTRASLCTPQNLATSSPGLFSKRVISGDVGPRLTDLLPHRANYRNSHHLESPIFNHFALQGVTPYTCRVDMSPCGIQQTNKECAHEQKLSPLPTSATFLSSVRRGKGTS